MQVCMYVYFFFIFTFGFVFEDFTSVVISENNNLIGKIKLAIGQRNRSEIIIVAESKYMGGSLLEQTQSVNFATHICLTVT